MRAAGETETTRENIQDWLQLDEGTPGFQLLTDEEIAAVTYIFYLFSSALPLLLKFRFFYYIRFFFFLPFRAIICFINPYDNSPFPINRV
jgi:hypothetical protein